MSQGQSLELEGMSQGQRLEFPCFIEGDMAIFEEGVCCYMWYSVPVFSAGLVRIVVGMCVPPIVSAGSLDLLWGNGKYPTLKLCSLCGVEKIM